MNEQLQLQIMQLVQAAMSGDQLASQQIQQIMLAAQQGDQLAALVAQMIQQVAQQMQGQQALMAKKGAKLNYIKQLRGQCPDGQEMGYYKVGGRVCKKCMQKLTEHKHSDPIEAFKSRRKFLKGGILDNEPSFAKAFKKARQNKWMYFVYKGKTYDTFAKGETRELWAREFNIDPTTKGGQRAETTPTSGWEGHKGYNKGKRNAKGEWVKSDAPSNDVAITVSTGIDPLSGIERTQYLGESPLSTVTGGNYTFMQNQRPSTGVDTEFVPINSLINPNAVRPNMQALTWPWMQ